jgi:hypothetical protein
VEGYLARFVVIFDSGQNWYLGSGDPAGPESDLRSFAVHESGHANGFNYHFGSGDGLCHFNSSIQTMCPVLPGGESWWRTLADHDLHTFENAYP